MKTKKRGNGRIKYSRNLIRDCRNPIGYCLLLAVCFLWLGGCSNAAPTGEKTEEKPEGNTISVYYINKAETRITPVAHTIEGGEADVQIVEAIDAMKENPVELSLRTPINGYEIKGWERKDTQIFLDVSEEYKKIQPTTEILLRAAIVRTLTQIDGIDHVGIRINGEALTDSLGATVGPMTADMFIDNAGNEINAYEKVRLKLYYANETGDKLIGVISNQVSSSNISMEKLVVERLIGGPDEDSKEAYPVLNPSTKLLGVTVKDGTCYVNFDEGFLTQIYNVTGEVVIYSVVNSLIELPNVNKVQITVNGETNLTYREKFNLSTVFDRNLDLIYGADK